MKTLSPPALHLPELQAQVWAHYKDQGRSMPWRSDPTPYKVLVSEFMLQQTSVERVTPKFRHWLEVFPDFSTLAQASVQEVVAAWKGLGYNRRALWLQAAALRVMADYNGYLPADIQELQSFTGIGSGTAGAVVAYAFNQPVVFIETNIRRVFLHHCFADAEGVLDTQLLPLIAAALDHARPREWYWALMDYGSWLGRTIPNPNRRSKHYVRQAAFVGSHRQLRGQILESVLLAPQTVQQLARQFNSFPAVQVGQAVDELAREGFLSCQNKRVTMKKN